MAYSFLQRRASFIEERERTVSPHLRHHMFRETVKFSNRYQAFFYAYQLGLIKDAPLLLHPHTSSSKSHSSVQIRSIFFFYMPRFEGSNWYSHIIPIFLDHIGLIRSTDGVRFLTPPDKLSAAPQQRHQTPLYSISKTQTFQNWIYYHQGKCDTSQPCCNFLKYLLSQFFKPLFFFCCRSHLPPKRNSFFFLLACNRRHKLSSVLPRMVAESLNCYKLVEMMCWFW